MSSPPPLPPKKKKPDWWSRNWKWFVPVLCFAAIFLFGAFFNLVLGFLKSSGAYKSAVAQAQQSELVQDAIGSPVNTGWLVTGNLNLKGQSGRSSLSIPIHGPKGKAKILMVARRTAGEWHFSHLQVWIDDQGLRIDLLKNGDKD